MSSRSKTTYTTRPVATPVRAATHTGFFSRREQPGRDEDHDTRHRSQIVEGDDVGCHDDEGEEWAEPRLGLPERNALLIGAQIREDDQGGQHRKNHTEAEGHEAGAGLAMIEEAEDPHRLLDHQSRNEQEHDPGDPLPRFHGAHPSSHHSRPLDQAGAASQAHTYLLQEWPQGQACCLLREHSCGRAVHRESESERRERGARPPFAQVDVRRVS